MTVELEWKAKEIKTYKCGHCGKEGLPSIWLLVKSNGEHVFLITECANDMRHDPSHYRAEDYKVIEL